MTLTPGAPIAFYAPMKAPTHPRPSGDRTIARALLRLLGGQARLVSDLRAHEKHGDAAAQAAIRAAADAEIERLIPLGRAEGWRLWATYHNYYKAPDLIGPAVARALEVPYVIFEAARSRKRLTGPWESFAKAAETATDAAAIAFYMTTRDEPELAAWRPEGQTITYLRPFLDIDDSPPSAVRRAEPRHLRLLTAAMMRPGDKLASYRALAAALSKASPTWRLTIAGDGAAAGQVRALFAPFGDRVAFAGALDAAALDQAYRAADAFIWPGVGEAFGMAYLEAQARGLPVIAENRPGVRDVCRAGAILTPPNDPGAMAAAIAHLTEFPQKCARIGAAARAQIAEDHLAPAARRAVWAALSALC